MFYFFIILNTYILFYSELISCIGSLLFLFVISVILVIIGITNQNFFFNTLNKIETVSLLSFIFWLKLEKIINLFEINLFNKLFNEVFNTNYNFLTKNYINENKYFFKKKNKFNIFEELNRYKKLITITF